MSATFFLLAGEASGDLHGAKLIEAIRLLRPTSRFVGMGGRRMEGAGLEVAKDLEGMQVLGFWEVAKKYGFFRQVFFQLLDRLKQERPDALICIDYPGFNLRFARQANRLGIPVLYYILPQIWAWKPGRARQMAECVDRAYCVFDFEPPFFHRLAARKRMKTLFVGHPLLDQPPPPPQKNDLCTTTSIPLLSFLPGLRMAEFEAHIQAMVQGFLLSRKELGPLRALISIPSGVTSGRFDHLSGQGSKDQGNDRLWINPSGPSGQRLLIWPKTDGSEESLGGDSLFPSNFSPARILTSLSSFSVVKSGTSVLEAGLSGNPFCTIYRGGWVSYGLARLMVDIPVFSLVNIILGSYVVPELLQGEVHPSRMAEEIRRGLRDERFRERQRASLAQLPGRLGGAGASKRTAQAILDFLEGKE